MIKELVNLIKIENQRQKGFLIDIDVDDYVHKIVNLAKIRTIQENNSIIAFIAYYDNNKFLNEAYLTMLLVKNEFQGMGYGKSLLKSAIDDVTQKGFYTFKLEVKKNNKEAIRLYERFGFHVEKDNGASIFMTLKL